MRRIRILLIVALSVLLAMGCDGGEGQVDGLKAVTNESAPASRETGADDPPRTVSFGGSVETCGGNSISLNAYEKRLLELHNQTREDQGLATLCVYPVLTEAARSYSKKMIEEDYFSHTSPDGESLGERLKRFGYGSEGYRYWKVGGNIAWESGSGDPEEIFEGLMDSPGHRANILDEDFRQIGIGTYSGAYKSYEQSVMYTIDFGTRNP